MPVVRHTVEVERPPSVVFERLTDLANLREWAPVVLSSRCADGAVEEGTEFTVVADLGSVGGPKYTFDNVVAEMVEDRRLVWRQTKGSMKKLEWRFELEPSERGTRVNLAIDYQMPYSVLGALMDKLKMNRVIDSACTVNLQGLKGKLESSS